MSKWWDQSWNPLIGCSHASPGCENCYAERLAGTRLKHLPNYVDATTDGKWNGNVLCLNDKLHQPMHWRKPKRIFVNDMGDTFHAEVPFAFIAAMYGVMAACPQHTFILLTKRPDRMLEFYDWIAKLGRSRAVMRRAEHPADPRWVHYACVEISHNLMSAQDLRPSCDPRVGWPLPNVWTGTTVEDQKRADSRIRILMQVPSALRLLSVEPLLEAIEFEFRELGFEYPVPNWVIVGGESGTRARQCKREWLESVKRECRDHGIPVYVKQVGSSYVDEKNAVGGRYVKVPSEYGSSVRRLKDMAGRNMAEWPENLRVRQYPEAT